ncbi:hypothetical protein M2401_004872 [Pseudomonas sp. JUb42]|uniref:hypothetical protein n=1 Tax=Pseudomonas sp. JUb42 TaxID=2940611 RepID=UPI002168222C|nr:hypothetical protein [Pseudomonas sp. JUb42]MCS3471111.1 hypothetical protein [Pseudomonas sp. JUb42]
MTNIVIWKNQATSEIFAAADSRLTNPKLMTDQASKILPLDVLSHRLVDEPYPNWQGMLGQGLGFAYAGAIAPALMTYMLVSKIVGSMGCMPVRLPSLESIATLVADVGVKMIFDVAMAYPCDNPPVCEFAIFGDDIGEEQSPKFYKGNNSAFHVYPTVEGVFSLKISRVDFTAGEYLVMGDRVQGLSDEIDRLDPEKQFFNMEPRIALQNRISGQSVESVGGTLQLFSVSGNTLRQHIGGNDSAEYLGYSIKDAEDILEVGLPLLRSGR